MQPSRGSGRRCGAGGAVTIERAVVGCRSTFFTIKQTRSIKMRSELDAAASAHVFVRGRFLWLGESAAPALVPPASPRRICSGVMASARAVAVHAAPQSLATPLWMNAIQLAGREHPS